MTPKYLNRFQKLTSSDLPLRGDRILLELLPKLEVKTKGGLVIATSLTDHRSTTVENAADIAVVLAVGSGYYAEDGTDVPLDVKVGNVVMVSRFGMRTYSSFPGLNDYVADTIALARESDCHIKWDTVEAFEAYTSKLNDGAL